MTRLLLAFLLFTTPALAGYDDWAQPPEIVDIKNDYGGELLKYDAAVRQLHSKFMVDVEQGRPATRVIIRGDCASACTLYLLYPFTCVHPDARLHFHAVRILETGLVNPDTTKWLFKVYPKKVRVWIESQGGLQRSLITLYGKELHETVRVCLPAELELGKPAPRAEF